MWQWLTQIEDLRHIDDVRLALRADWPGAAIGLILLGVLSLGLWLYSGYGTAAGRRRWLLAGLRAVLLSFIVLLLFEPIVELDAQVSRRSDLLVLVDSSQSMRLADARPDNEDVYRAAIALGLVPLDAPGAEVTMRLRERVGRPQRLELAAGLLRPDGADLLNQLSAQHRVHLYQFGRNLRAIESSEPISAEPLTLSEDEADATALGTAMQQAMERHAGHQVAGLLILTDGASNSGPDPLAIARRLGQQQIPVHSIGLGTTAPDDVQINSALVQDVVFPQDRVPVRITLSSSGYAGRPTVVSVHLNDRPVASRAVNLQGGVQFETFEFQPQPGDLGRAQLRVSVGQMPGEATDENNHWSRSIIITDERIRVLYIEGKPRWEYRYLRRVLERDPRIDVDYYMTEGDVRLAKNADTYLSQFPDDAAAAFAYDLVILGDVAPSVFTDAQLARLEELVARQGGALMMIAGRRFAPVSYRGTVVEKMLPVRLGDADRAWLKVPDEVHPRLTVSGERAGVARVGDQSGEDQLIWQRVTPLEQLADLDGAKPGASVWLTLSQAQVGGQEYPLVAWHRYGAGRCLYVGSDALWRLRMLSGSVYHERFWSQSIQFVALARLLAGRDRIRLETDKSRYLSGEPIHLYATVQDEAWEPMIAAKYEVRLSSDDPNRAVQRITLDPLPQRPGVFEGTISNLGDGEYRIEPLESAGQKVSAKFAVEAAVLELRQSALDAELLERLAGASGGLAVRPDSLGNLIEALRLDVPVVRKRLKLELWDVPATYILVVLLAGSEWLLRRQISLP